MNFDQFRTQNLIKWKRIVMLMYWVILILFILGQLMVLMMSLHTDQKGFALHPFLLHHMLFPDGLLIGVLLLAHYLLRKIPKASEIVLVLCSGIISYTIYLFMHKDVYGEQIVLILPIFISLIFFERSKLLWNGTAHIALFSVVYWIVNPYQGNHSIFEFVVSMISFVAYMTIALIVVARVKDLWKLLEESKKTEQELMIRSILLDKMTKIDALTGMYNHKTFHEYMEKLIEHSKRHAIPLQLCIMDIDNFKQVNDTYGHQIGDKVLKQVGEIIHGMVTPNDIVSRYGGEEFAVIFMGRSLEECIQNMEDIRKKIESTPIEELEDNPVTISAGISTLQPSEEKDKLFQRVDALLYKAKRSGKNNLIFEM
ncbi:GGDEF domain-containing protein [Marinicrinis lubricantis]|uniref:GGDEF domain-containing protein n=1 Tax=Marinicrinis lubricantis TaxID=2086470 RepID=A0ABW1IKP8_9BACL